MVCKRKGFTIVELVVVIAVIAILTAVLIPTFAGIVNKAKLSDDITFCVAVNTDISIIAIDNDIKTCKQLFKNLLSTGYKYSDFKCRSEGNHFVYDQINNMIAMFDKDFNVVYSTQTLSAKSWLIIDDETKVDLFLNSTSIYGVLIINESSVTQVEKENQPIYANETNLTEIISNCTSVDNVVKFTASQIISFDINVDVSNALTLDLCGFTVEFNNVSIYNKGMLKLINGGVIFTNDSQIYNNAKMIMQDLSIVATGNNKEFYALVNQGELKLIDSTIKTDGLCCIENKVDAYMEIDGGEYSSNVFSTILNNGNLSILSGNFYRKSNDIQVGAKGTVYAVINNVGASANLTVTNGNFINEYPSLPSQRRNVVIYNKGGVINVIDAVLQNKCNHKDAVIIYTELNTATITINNAVMTVANSEAFGITKAISTDKQNIKIYNLTLNGSAKLNETNVTIEALYFVYDYVATETPKVILTNIIPSVFEASVNHRFYMDVDMLTANDFVANAVIRINKTPQDLTVILNRTHLGEQNLFTVIYGIDTAEIVSVFGDFDLQKVDCTADYLGAVKAYQYYCSITETTATFKVVYPSGQIDYFSAEEFVDALNVAKEIVFLKDLQLNSTVAVRWEPRNDLTIDLNGKTWTENGDVSYMLQCSKSDYILKIVDGSVDCSGKMIFNATQNGIAMFSLYAPIVITNGTFISNCNVFYIHGSNYGTEQEYETLIYAIQGGTFVGGVLIGDFAYIGKLIISGGSFTFDPTQYLSTGLVAEFDGEGVYCVKYDN